MKIAVISPLFSRSSELRSALNAFCADVIYNDDNRLKTKEDIINFLRDADAAIVGREMIDDEILSHCPRLQMLSRYGVGLDNLDLEAMKQRNIALGWSGGTNANSVAEITLGFMLSLMRNLHRSTSKMKQGIWKVNGGRELSGKTIGLFGFGHISKRLIELLQPFHCTILVYNRTHDEDEAKRYGITFATKERIIAECDILSIHLPLTSETHGMFSTKEFIEMKKEAFIINTARGGIIDEAALKIALSSGEIAGAALEAFSVEPVEDKELIALENLICTPHLGGNSYESILNMGFSCIEHLKEFYK